MPLKDWSADESTPKEKDHFLASTYQCSTNSHLNQVLDHRCHVFLLFADAGESFRGLIQEQITRFCKYVATGHQCHGIGKVKDGFVMVCNRGMRLVA